MSSDDKKPRRQVFDLAAVIAGAPASEDARLALCAVTAHRDQLLLLQLNSRFTNISMGRP